MKASEEKISSTAQNEVQAKREPFFTKEGHDNFFSNTQSGTTNFFNASAFSSTSGSNNGNVVQKKCSACEKEEKLQKKESHENAISRIQRKSIFEINDQNTSTQLEDQSVIQAKYAAFEEEDKITDKTNHTSDRNAQETAISDGVNLNKARNFVPNHILQRISKIEEKQRDNTDESAPDIQKAAQLGPIAIGAAIIAAAAICALPFYYYAMGNYWHKGDKWLHCYTSCKIATFCGVGTAVLVGYAKEIGDYICDELGGPCGAEWGDILANNKGISCALTFWKSCYECCDENYS